VPEIGAFKAEKFDTQMLSKILQTLNKFKAEALNYVLSLFFRDD